MDDSLREMGVGDLSVGKKIRGLAEAFYGRVGVYEECIDNDSSAETLSSALLRNVYGGDAQGDPEMLAAYTRAVDESFSNESFEAIKARGFAS